MTIGKTQRKIQFYQNMGESLFRATFQDGFSSRCLHQTYLSEYFAKTMPVCLFRCFWNNQYFPEAWQLCTDKFLILKDRRQNIFFAFSLTRTWTKIAGQWSITTRHRDNRCRLAVLGDVLTFETIFVETGGKNSQWLGLQHTCMNFALHSGHCVKVIDGFFYGVLRALVTLATLQRSQSSWHCGNPFLPPPSVFVVVVCCLFLRNAILISVGISCAWGTSGVFVSVVALWVL